MVFPSAKVLWGVGGRRDFNTVMDESMDRWPPKDRAPHELGNICNRLDLIDIWRHKHPNQNIYTWNNKDRSQQSCRDFWLVPSENKVDSVMIEPVFTDHKAVTINVNFGMVRRSPNKDYWKLNKLLLQNKQLKKETQTII